MESVEAATIGNELRPLFLEDFPDRPIGPLGMGVRLRPGRRYPASGGQSSTPDHIARIVQPVAETRMGLDARSIRHVNGAGGNIVNGRVSVIGLLSGQIHLKRR